ncbi:hypothetical protein CryarDRAFT_0188 [Cryptosporangium arvum DSM 44712]|uniref:Molecular chaperone DnaJ n=1 Tax=Cryptosporangium arvum DSM 44712 TaxID=927661 RepID=A0A010ZPL1_9ACTN|nr:hypothetical protein CryarDRAFT_0188 [Cryptosporangium arvum DSM 44712]
MADQKCTTCNGHGSTAHSAGGSGYTYKCCTSCNGTGRKS